MKALLVDDDAALLDTLRTAFEAAGWEVETAADGNRALAAAEGADVIVSDVNMPGLDGFALCRKLREAKSAVPFVLLTSRDSEIDEALGLDLGADDYVTKPFSVRVLLARIDAILRRAKAPAEASAPLRAGKLVLDRDRLEVRFCDVVIPATLTEFRLLEALASRPGRVLSRQQLLSLAREDDSVVTPRVVDTYVARLRRKMEAIEPGANVLETVVGAGYRLRDG